MMSKGVQEEAVYPLWDRFALFLISLKTGGDYELYSKGSYAIYCRRRR